MRGVAATISSLTHPSTPAPYHTVTPIYPIHLSSSREFSRHVPGSTFPRPDRITVVTGTATACAAEHAKWSLIRLPTTCIRSAAAAAVLLSLPRSLLLSAHTLRMRNMIAHRSRNLKSLRGAILLYCLCCLFWLRLFWAYGKIYDQRSPGPLRPMGRNGNRFAM